MDNYIVYVAKDPRDGTCLYVGEGKPDRYKHVNSGTSHVYEANKWHFRNKPMQVDVVHTGLTKEKAREIEQQLINELNPLWNKSYFNSKAPYTQLVKFCKDRIYSFEHRLISDARKDRVFEEVKSMCKMLNARGECTILYASNIDGFKTKYLSECCSKNKNAYPLFKQIFDIKQDRKGRRYHIELKGWKEYFDIHYIGK